MKPNVFVSQSIKSGDQITAGEVQNKKVKVSVIFSKRIAGDEYVGFNNSVFLSERETADRNFAMAYFMRENKCFPPGFNLQDTMDLYFQVKVNKMCKPLMDYIIKI